MAKQAAVKPSGGASVPASHESDKLVGRKSLEPKSSHGSTESRPTKLKSSSLLDTRVIYCGDNLEQLA
ncbi:MAG: hypothetical protein ACREFE_20165, partial [Limisphaerales bacterium]